MLIKNIWCRIKLAVSGKTISAYLDGELSGPRLDKARRLLDECPGAKARYDRLMAIEQILRSVPKHDPPDAIKERIERAIRNRPLHTAIPETPRKRSYRPVFAWTSVLAALIVVVAIGLHVHSTNLGRQTMFADIDMYRHLQMYEHMDMFEHMDEVMAYEKTVTGGQQ